MIDIFLAEGFEEIEALCPLDLMRRAGLEVRTIGVGAKMIKGAHGICVEADDTVDNYTVGNAEMVFLPGGMPGTLNLAANQTVISAVKNASDNGKYIAAICAAPSILGDMGLLNGKEAICYPGFEDRLTGARLSQKRVVRDENIITAAGMGVALDFGLEIVKLFCGYEKADELRRSVIADN